MSTAFAILIAAASLAAGTVASRAADEPAKPSPKPEAAQPLTPEQRRARVQEFRQKHAEEFEKLREELKGLPPEERQKRMREFRDTRGRALIREELEKHREELRKLPPEQRAARMRELRQQFGERPFARNMTPDERKFMREEIKGRFERRLRELRQKKADGTLTDSESKRLERMEAMAKRFKEAREEAPKPDPKAP